jgi:hypothetical protein
VNFCLTLRRFSLVDCGDYVVCTNAKFAPVTGKKAQQKIYYSHSGYPGGLKQVPFLKMRENKPEEVRFALLCCLLSIVSFIYLFVYRGR